MRRFALLGNAFVALLLVALPAYSAEPLVIHEWGTFTALQDEQGRSLGRINTDDEPVPSFVHQIPSGSLFPPTAAYTSDSKGSPAGDPAVTVRLETPVLYFHVPRDLTAPLTVGVDVAFRGGWLTQYFPEARARIEDASGAISASGLNSTSVGRLSWQNIVLNSTQGELPVTKDPVWTAPRAVEASAIAVGKEREQFLFYRGVGHVDAPVRIVRKGAELEIRAVSEGLAIPQAWLVEVLGDGALAFRGLPRIEAGGVDRTSAEFNASDFGRKNLGNLKVDLRGALVASGLFEDEANALLNTWERSYFQNPGQRVFFVVPPSWTEDVLPLKVSASLPTQMRRVMVGRIELVTPAQRTLLQRLASAAPVDAKGLKQATAAMARLRNDPSKAAVYNALAAGHGNLSELGVAVPQVYTDFLALGRFRTALLLNSDDASLSRLAISFTP